jgi:hypothetical protein
MQQRLRFDAATRIGDLNRHRGVPDGGPALFVGKRDEQMLRTRRRIKRMHIAMSVGAQCNLGRNDAKVDDDPIHRFDLLCGRLRRSQGDSQQDCRQGNRFHELSLCLSLVHELMWIKG